MSATVTYEAHPLAALIPAMTDDEYADLRNDVAANGLRVPITLYEGKVLDGRHRLRACEETGTEPRFDEYSDDAPTEFVVSLNLKRRNLNESQIAMVSAGLEPALAEEARIRQVRAGEEHGRGMDSTAPNGADLSKPHRAADDAADATGASTRSVQRAKRVKDAAPDLAAKQASHEARPARVALAMTSLLPPRVGVGGGTATIGAVAHPQRMSRASLTDAALGVLGALGVMAVAVNYVALSALLA